MGTQEGSPTEPSQAHSRQVGRGGIGNIQEARKWNVIPADEPPHRFDPNDHMNQPHIVGRGGSGNFKVGPEESMTEREHRLSTSAKNSDDAISLGRGGFGNIEAAQERRRRKEEEKAKQSAMVSEKARAIAKAAADSIQMPKPARATTN